MTTEPPKPDDTRNAGENETSQPYLLTQVPRDTRVSETSNAGENAKNENTETKAPQPDVAEASLDKRVSETPNAGEKAKNESTETKTPQPDVTEAPLDERVRRVAEEAARKTIWASATFVLGALGLSGAAVFGWIFFTLPDAAINKALTIIESRTVNITQKLSETIQRFGEIQGQTALLTENLATVRGLSTRTTEQLGEIRGAITGYRDQMRALELEQKTAQSTLTSLGTERAALTRQIAQLNTDRITLEAELKSAQESIAALKASVTQAGQLIDLVKGFTPADWSTFRDRVSILALAAKQIDTSQRIESAYNTALSADTRLKDTDGWVRHERFGNQALRRDFDLFKGDMELQLRLLTAPANPGTVHPWEAIGMSILTDMNRLVRDSQTGNEALAQSRLAHDQRLLKAEAALAELTKPKPPQVKPTPQRKPKKKGKRRR